MLLKKSPFAHSILALVRVHKIGSVEIFCFAKVLGKIIFLFLYNFKLAKTIVYVLASPLFIKPPSVSI